MNGSYSIGISFIHIFAGYLMTFGPYTPGTLLKADARSRSPPFCTFFRLHDAESPLYRPVLRIEDLGGSKSSTFMITPVIRECECGEFQYFVHLIMLGASAVNSSDFSNNLHAVPNDFTQYQRLAIIICNQGGESAPSRRSHCFRACLNQL